MKLDQQRVLAGSLNLLTPSDKTIANDAIDLRNWRVDQAGVLRGGDSFVVMHNFGAPVHTIFKLDDFAMTQAYVNGVVQIAFGGSGATAGGFLVGAGTSLFFHWPAAGTTTTLVTGLSGQPLSILVWNGFIWVLDSLKQIKIDPAKLTGIFTGAAVTSWLPAEPASPVIVAANTSGNGPLVGTYSYYCTYVSYVFPLVGGYKQAKESAAGPGVSVTAAGGVVSIIGLPYLTSVDAIRVYRSGGSLAPSYFVKQFGVGLDPTGTYCNVYLTAAYPSATSSWSDTLSDAAITATGIIMPTSGVTGAPSAPTLTATVVAGFNVSAASGLVGTYQYYETYVNSAGLETNPGPVSANVTPTNGYVDLVLTISPDPDTVRRRLYRDGGTLGDAYQVKEFTDNTTATYTDGAPDLAITELGIEMPTTNDPPPTGVAANSMGMAGPYFDQLLGWKDGRMYWSQVGLPLFPGSQDGSATGNWVNVGSPDDKIQAITLHSRLAAIHKQRTIWRLLGDAVTGTLEQTAATTGAIGKAAVANCGAYDLVLGKDGLYQFTMDALVPQSDKVSPVFMNQQWLGLGFSDTSQNRAQDVFGLPQHPFCAYLNGASILGNGGGYPSDELGTTFLYHPATERWAAFSSSQGFALTAALGFGSQFDWFAGDVGGNLLRAQQLSNGAQQLTWQTRFLDQDLGDTPKNYQEIVLDAELNGGGATVYILFDNTSTATALSTVAAPYKWVLSGAGRKKFYMPLSPDDADADGSTGADAYPHISVRIELAVLDGAIPPAIHGLYVYYSVEERDASMRGTEVLDFHSERITVCKKIEVDVLGQVNLAIWTDLPGGIAQRFVFAGPATTARGIFEFPLPPNLRGRLWRVDVLPQASTARVYAVRGWMREIGLAASADWSWRDFLAGTAGETPDAE